MTARVVVRNNSKVNVTNKVDFFVVIPRLSGSVVSLFRLEGSFFPTTFASGASKASAVNDVVVCPSVLKRRSKGCRSPTAFKVSSIRFLVNRDEVSCRGSDCSQFVHAGYKARSGNYCRWSCRFDP